MALTKKLEMRIFEYRGFLGGFMSNISSFQLFWFTAPYRTGVGNSFGSAGHIRDKKGTEGPYILTLRLEQALIKLKKYDFKVIITINSKFF